MSRRRGSLAGSPLLIGAITTLIVVIAVYISYNANHGLPFTPTYDIKVELPSAANLFPGNDVRIGGTRVGIVEKLVPELKHNGHLVVIAYLKLEKNVQPLPVDSTATVPSISPVGLKYLALERGSSRRGIPAGDTIPVSQVHEQVEIGQFFDMFKPKTRVASQRNLSEFGAGLAGRGIGLNEAFATLRPLVRHATPVLRNLAAPETDFGGLWEALDRAAKEAAPVATQQGELYAYLNTFFGAWAGVSPAVEATIEGGPAALRTATYSFRFEAPFIDKTAEFMRLLRPSASALRVAAPPLAHAFKVGAVNFAAAQELNGQIASATKAVQRFAEDPIVETALADLTRFSAVGQPLIGGLEAAQVECNYLSLVFRNIASFLSGSIGVGTTARVDVVLPASGVNSEGYPASAPANGPSEEHETGHPTELRESNHLHYNPYPSIKGCEAGNQGYTAGRTEIGPASKVEHGRETSITRDTNLFGQPYPPQVEEDLGRAKKGGR